MTWFFIVTDIIGAILCDVATLVQNKYDKAYRTIILSYPMGSER